MAVLEKAAPSARWTRNLVPQSEPLRGAFFWLSAFYLVYCARPEDWIPGLKYLPLAKITGICAVVALAMSAGKSKRKFRDLPRESAYLLAIICLLIVSAFLSPVWKGGAFFKTLDFAKVLVAWVLTYAVITNFERLRRIIFIQSVSVVAIAIVSMLRVRSHPRLDGAIGGIYSNPNDLAFAIVLSLPFCFAFLLSSRSGPRKAAWLAAMLVMLTALFLTASRAGFIDLLVTGTVCLWFFGVKGKRIHLIAAAALVALVVGVAAGGRLKDRFFAISGENLQAGMEQSAYGSFEQRRELMVMSLHTIERYPWGIGMENFANYSGVWREVHVAYLQIAVEGGIASLIFYLMFFARGFGNLRQVRRMRHDQERALFIFALHGSLVGFVVGALFAPEAYQFFPYFAVAYTSVLLAMAKEEEREGNPAAERLDQPTPRLARGSGDGRFGLSGPVGVGRRPNLP
jgi:O-antigen ligase